MQGEDEVIVVIVTDQTSPAPCVRLVLISPSSLTTTSSRSSYPFPQSTVMFLSSFCAALCCHRDVPGVGMHLASLIQQPSFKRGAFPASFHNNKGFPNTPSPPCHMWSLYYLLSPALFSNPQHGCWMEDGEGIFARKEMKTW